MGALHQHATHYLEGKIEHGKKLGRTIGFPTANIYVEKHVVPQKGVYGVYVYLEQQRYTGVMNVGNRPTFCDGDHTTIEVHLLDFEQDIYGKTIAIEVVFQLRNEKKFPSINVLMHQIKQDVNNARKKFLAIGL